VITVFVDLQAERDHDKRKNELNDADEVEEASDCGQNEVDSG